VTEPKNKALTHEENKAHNQKILDEFYKENAALYAPQREWQGLTDEERYLGDARSEEEIEYARAIEAKLKEKNNG